MSVILLVFRMFKLPDSLVLFSVDACVVLLFCVFLLYLRCPFDVICVCLVLVFTLVSVAQRCLLSLRLSTNFQFLSQVPTFSSSYIGSFFLIKLEFFISTLGSCAAGRTRSQRTTYCWQTDCGTAGQISQCSSSACELQFAICMGKSRICKSCSCKYFSV